VDNFPGTSAITSLTVRKPRKLWPAPGATLAWTLRDDLSDLVLQSGTVQAEADGLVAVTGLVIPKDPQRVRLEFRVAGALRPGDLDQDGTIDYEDVQTIQVDPVDLDGDGLANVQDIDLLQRYVLRNGCDGDLDDTGLIDGGDVAMILLDLGPCESPCAADLDGSGMVDAGDLSLALLRWGPCGRGAAR
jgi:hypothetical protein